MPAWPDNETLLAWVDAARHGDDHALARLIRATQPAVWRFCANLASPHEVDDICQEALIRVSRNVGQYRGEAPVMAWVLSIARYVCADQVRRNQRRARLATRLRAERATPVPETGNYELTALLDELGHDRREAFVLTQVVGLSYEEAAAVCDCPVGTIRSRVARARGDLIAALRRSEAI